MNNSNLKLPILLACCFAFVMFSCVDDCVIVSVPEIRQVMFAALENPETFDDFISNNRDFFDSEFMDCFNSNLNKLRELEQSERQLCNDAHTQGSDFWHRCHDEVDQNYGNAVAFNTDVLNAINGVRSFQSSEYGQSLIMLKLFFPEDYSFMVEFLKEFSDEITAECEVCKRKFFLCK